MLIQFFAEGFLPTFACFLEYLWANDAVLDLDVVLYSTEVYPLTYKKGSLGSFQQELDLKGQSI